jgi:hypothetical protein
MAAKVRRYLISVGVLFVLLAVGYKGVEQLLSPEAIGALRGLNLQLVRSVEQLDPWSLATTFYSALWRTMFPPSSVPFAPPPSMDPVSVALRLIVGLFRLATYAIPMALIATLGSIISQGATSIVVAVVAAVLGTLVFIVIGIIRDEEPDIRVSLLLVPVLGSGCMWALLQVMRLASLVFGWALGVAEGIAAVSATVPLAAMLLRAVLQEREGAAADAATDWLDDRAGALWQRATRLFAGSRPRT